MSGVLGEGRYCPIYHLGRQIGQIAKQGSLRILSKLTLTYSQKIPLFISVTIIADYTQINSQLSLFVVAFDMASIRHQHMFIFTMTAKNICFHLFNVLVSKKKSWTYFARTLYFNKLTGGGVWGGEAPSPVFYMFQ